MSKDHNEPLMIDEAEVVVRVFRQCAEKVKDSFTGLEHEFFTEAVKMSKEDFQDALTVFIKNIYLGAANAIEEKINFTRTYDGKGGFYDGH